jgi:Ca-activated chloride channel family protein
LTAVSVLPLPTYLTLRNVTSEPSTSYFAAAPSTEATALRHLWARQRIAQLSDEEALVGASSQRDPITALGLQYGLLTHYTSFIAVDQVVRTAEAAVPVNQPLPLPQGVGALAVGTEGAQASATVGAVVPTTPEPGWMLSLALMSCGALGVALLRRRSIAGLVS